MSEHYDKVRSGLSARLGEGKSWYVLVDPAIDDPLKDCMGRRQAVPLAARHPDMPRRFRPYLLELGEIGRDDRIDLTIRIALHEALRTSPRDGSKRSVCGWIASGRPVAAIAAHLVRQTRIVVCNSPRMLRIWDPRTLDLLRYLFKGNSMRALSLSGSSWCWLGRDGDLRELEGNPVQDERHESRLSISEEQIDVLLLADAFHSTLNVLQDMHKDVVDDTTLREIVDALRRARSHWGIVDPLDRVRFALHACLIHGSFDTDEQVETAMRQAGTSTGSCMQGLAAFDEKAWGAVRERLNSGHANTRPLTREKVHHG